MIQNIKNSEKQSLKGISQKEMLERLTMFTEDSLRSCSVQAEQSVNLVAKILDDIVSDSARVSKISEDTIQILSRVNAVLIEREKHAGVSTAKPPLPKDLIRQVVEALKAVGERNSEVSEYVAPMIESLQFQDRIRQQMDNLPKMLRLWTERRNQLNENEQAVNRQQFMEKFGQDLLAVSISEQERAVIRNNIPGLPEPENLLGDNFFF
jgi:hypothetical protein